jgi:hypothetical protein
VRALYIGLNPKTEKKKKKKKKKTQMPYLTSLSHFSKVFSFEFLM